MCYAEEEKHQLEQATAQGMINWGCPSSVLSKLHEQIGMGNGGKE